MQDSPTALVPVKDWNEIYRSVVSDLMSLVEHFETVMALIETEIASEPPPEDQEMAADVVVLDDVTPRYLKASAALDICRAGLGAALDLMQAAETPGCRTDSSATRAANQLSAISHQARIW